MNPCLSLLFAVLLFGVCASPAAEMPFAPVGVQNPKDLAAPVSLAAADVILDGGSLSGTLRGADGREFVFFLGQSFFEGGYHGLYVGYTGGHIPESARASFAGWTSEDFCRILEGAIRARFHQDAASGRLLPNDPHQPTPPFTATAAKRLLRYCQR